MDESLQRHLLKTRSPQHEDGPAPAGLLSSKKGEIRPQASQGREYGRWRDSLPAPRKDRILDRGCRPDLRTDDFGGSSMRGALRRQPWETKKGLPEQHLVYVRSDASLLTLTDLS